MEKDERFVRIKLLSGLEFLFLFFWSLFPYEFVRIHTRLGEESVKKEKRKEEKKKRKLVDLWQDVGLRPEVF